MGADELSDKSDNKFVPRVLPVNERQLIYCKRYLLKKQKRLAKRLMLLTKQMLVGSIQHDWEESLKETLCAMAIVATKGNITLGGRHSHFLSRLREG